MIGHDFGPGGSKSFDFFASFHRTIAGMTQRKVARTYVMIGE